MIQQNTLIEFVKSNANFAEYTYDCGATDFINHETDIDFTTDKFTHIYTFKEFYLNPENFSYYPSYPYQVLSISEKAYLMYKIEEEIFIWVCYTELEYRNQGYMKKLLKHLKSMFPEQKIVLDTFNEHLRNTAQKIGIGLFPR